MPITLDVLKKYPNPYFLETGSYKGTTIQLALDIGFEKIISIEIYPFLYNICVERFKQNNKVTLYCGDVELELEKILVDIKTPVTFWLDAHYSGLGTSKGIHNDPILQELDIIGRHPIKTHTILIDDIRLMDKKLVTEKVKEINNTYSILFENGFEKNDIMVATSIN